MTSDTNGANEPLTDLARNLISVFDGDPEYLVTLANGLKYFKIELETKYGVELSYTYREPTPPTRPPVRSVRVPHPPIQTPSLEDAFFENECRRLEEMARTHPHETSAV